MSVQKKINPFKEMNQYKGRYKDAPSSAVFEKPRRTNWNNWKKFHAERDCGSDSVYFVENATSYSTWERGKYVLYCFNCSHEVREEEVLFIGGQWYEEIGWKEYGRPLDDLTLPEDRVLELGPNPKQDQLKRMLNLTRIEQNISLYGLSFNNATQYECEKCERKTHLIFDGYCRICYDGEWTERMTKTLDRFTDLIRVRNNSFAHRLEKHIDPFSIKNRLFKDKILWRYTDSDRFTKIVEVKSCLKDVDSDEWRYILTDPHRDKEWIVTEKEIKENFWDTSHYNEQNTKLINIDWVKKLPIQL